MRAYSKVSPRLWTGQVGKAIRGNPYAQALASYLVTTHHGNMVGLYHLPVAYIAVDLGWELEDTEAALQALSDEGFAAYDRETERVWILDHARHELGESLKPGDNRIKAIQRILEDHRGSPLVRDFLDRYGAPFNLFMEGLNEHREAPSKPLRSQEQEQEQEQEQKQEQASSSESLARSEPPFLVYPVVGKGPSEWKLQQDQVAEWQELYPGLDVRAECREALAWCQANPRRRKTARGMPAFLVNWLNRAVKRGNQRPRRKNLEGIARHDDPPRADDRPEIEVDPEAAARWEKASEQLEQTMDPQVWDTWIHPLSLAAAMDPDGTLVVIVPNEVFADWITGKYGDEIRSALGGDFRCEVGIPGPARQPEEATA